MYGVVYTPRIIPKSIMAATHLRAKDTHEKMLQSS